MTEERVFIAGAGPVGLSAAARLIHHGVPVTVFESGPGLATESRASTFHPSTLDMLEEIGAAAPLQEQGLRAPHLQYRSKRDGLIARFDFGDIDDLTKHPFRLQCEQWRLTQILLNKLTLKSDFEIVFSNGVEDCHQDADSVTVVLTKGERTGRWLIGADGASSHVRHAINVTFEGFTWPDRFLVLSTPFEFTNEIPNLDPVSYVADPQQWHFLLRIPGLWRVMLPIATDMTDDAALNPDYGCRCLDWVAAGAGSSEVVHRTLYRVHQRVAKTFRKGRVFLAGDAAHINNPLGGMGMNGGIHDAFNLTDRLAHVWMGLSDAAQLDLYDLQRRTVTMEAVQVQTIQNKKDMESADENDQAQFRNRLRNIMRDPEENRAYLQRISMIESLQRAAKIS